MSDSNKTPEKEMIENFTAALLLFGYGKRGRFLEEHLETIREAAASKSLQSRTGQVKQLMEALEAIKSDVTKRNMKKKRVSNESEASRMEQAAEVISMIHRDAENSNRELASLLAFFLNPGKQAIEDYRRNQIKKNIKRKVRAAGRTAVRKRVGAVFGNFGKNLRKVAKNPFWKTTDNITKDGQRDNQGPDQERA